MVRVASKMTVYKNCYDEYEKRHNEIWPEMVEMLRKHGISNYSIFLEEETGFLFAYFEAKDKELADSVSKDPACAKWWDYMKDIMETNSNNSPVSIPLRSVFYME